MKRLDIGSLPWDTEINLQRASQYSDYYLQNASNFSLAMPSRHDSRGRSGCPISLSLEMFGDRWSLLIVRDLMFSRFSTFKEFASAGEGIATNVLADRLERLEEAGIIHRQQDPDDGRRVTYRLTRKGWDLAPMLVELVIWAARYEDTEAPPATVRQMKANRDEFIAELKKHSGR